MASRQYSSPEELRKAAEEYFCATGGWAPEGVAADGLTLSQRIASKPGAVDGSVKHGHISRAAACVPDGWALWAGFEGYEAFLELRYRGGEWAAVVAWVDTVLRKCAEHELMVSDRKNNRGPEILVGTFWGMAAKQVVDLRNGIEIITRAAMTELASAIPMDDREKRVQRFKAAVLAAKGQK